MQGMESKVTSVPNRVHHAPLDLIDRQELFDKHGDCSESLNPAPITYGPIRPQCTHNSETTHTR